MGMSRGTWFARGKNRCSTGSSRRPPASASRIPPKASFTFSAVSLSAMIERLPVSRLIQSGVDGFNHTRKLRVSDGASGFSLTRWLNHSDLSVAFRRLLHRLVATLMASKRREAAWS
jgi:hypothetical protein